IMPNQGDIVLIPVPFTDLSSQKRCPVIVVSNDTYNQSGLDVVVVAMTSNPASSPLAFQISSADLIAGALNRPGMVRPDKIYMLAKSIVVKTFGQVSQKVVERIISALNQIVAP